MNPFFIAAMAAAAIACSAEKGRPELSERPAAPNLAPAELPQQPMVLGLGTHALEPHPRAVMRDLGVRHVRFTLYTHLWNADAAYRAKVKQQVADAATEGFRVLLTVHPWTEADGGPRAFASWIAAAARDLRGAEVWQIGNEVAFDGDGARHAAYQDVAYAAIKRVNPSAKVISMAIAGRPTDLLEGEWQAAFLAARPRMDALALHTYAYPLTGAVESTVASARTALARHDLDVPIWITEFGMSRDMIPVGLRRNWEAVQREQWQHATRAAEEAGVARVYGYQLQTDESGRSGPVETHGLVRSDWTLRPVALWLKSRNR